MSQRSSRGRGFPVGSSPDSQRLDDVVVAARRAREERMQGYRDKALKLFPWVCGRCAREFSHSNLRELTVHHKDGNHDNNPQDGSNWELLCLYCHDNEHRRYEDYSAGSDKAPGAITHPSTDATQRPFSQLAELLKKGQ